MALTPAQQIGMIGSAYPRPNRVIRNGRIYFEDDRDSVDLDYKLEYDRAIGGAILAAMDHRPDVAAEALKQLPSGVARDAATIEVAERVARGMVAANIDIADVTSAAVCLGEFLVYARTLISNRIELD